MAINDLTDKLSANVPPGGGDQVGAPPGGTGTAAGAYDSAANRDSLINLVNAMRAVLIDKGLMKGGI